MEPPFRTEYGGGDRYEPGSSTNDSTRIVVANTPPRANSCLALSLHRLVELLLAEESLKVRAGSVVALPPRPFLHGQESLCVATAEVDPERTGKAFGHGP